MARWRNGEKAQGISDSPCRHFPISLFPAQLRGPLPSGHIPLPPPIEPRRARCGLEQLLHLPHLDFRCRRWRRTVLVQLTRFSFDKVAIRECPHHDSLSPAARTIDGQLVAGSQLAMRFRHQAVDHHAADFACTLRFGSGLEQARDVEPHVEANRIRHPCKLSRD